MSSTGSDIRTQTDEAMLVSPSTKLDQTTPSHESNSSRNRCSCGKIIFKLKKSPGANEWYERLHRKHAEQEEKRRLRSKELREEEAREYTFLPKTNSATQGSSMSSVSHREMKVEKARMDYLNGKLCDDCYKQMEVGTGTCALEDFTANEDLPSTPKHLSGTLPSSALPTEINFNKSMPNLPTIRSSHRNSGVPKPTVFRAEEEKEEEHGDTPSTSPSINATSDSGEQQLEPRPQRVSHLPKPGQVFTPSPSRQPQSYTESEHHEAEADLDNLLSLDDEPHGQDTEPQPEPVLSDKGAPRLKLSDSSLLVDEGEDNEKEKGDKLVRTIDKNNRSSGSVTRGHSVEPQVRQGTLQGGSQLGPESIPDLPPSRSKGNAPEGSDDVGAMKPPQSASEHPLSPISQDRTAPGQVSAPERNMETINKVSPVLRDTPTSADQTSSVAYVSLPKIDLQPQIARGGLDPSMGGSGSKPGDVHVSPPPPPPQAMMATAKKDAKKKSKKAAKSGGGGGWSCFCGSSTDSVIE